MGTGWEKDTSTKAGPIAEPIAKEALRLSTERGGAPLLFLSGNGGGDGKMPEADRMQNHVATLVKEAIRNGNTGISVPEVHTDTEVGPETGFIPSRSTYSNAANLVTFIKDQSANGNSTPEEIHIVSLDAHISRVVDVTRKALNEAGLVNIAVVPHDIDGKGLYNERNGQLRLRNETVFKIWNGISYKVWKTLNGK